MLLPTFVAAVLLTFIMAGCKSSGAGASKSEAFHYDAASGKCVNSSGQTGMNTMDIKRIRQDKNCECVKMGEIELVDLLPNIDENNRFAYNELLSFNFRGADLSQASLHFNHIIDADFSGANMKDFSFGYANISGKMDKYTVIPEDGCFPNAEAGTLECAK